MKNFLSVGNVTLALNLSEHGLTLVLGDNKDTNGGVSRNGAGKAQPLDAKIKTPFGWSRMGDMKIGDLVETPSGRYGRVDGVFPQGEIPVYKLTFADGRSTEACGDHIWKVWSRNGNWAWSNKTTTELLGSIDGSPGHRAYVPLISNVSAPEADLPMDPRLMGILLGDGHMSGLSFSSKDEEIIRYVRENTPNEYSLSKQNECDFRISRGKGKKGHNCHLRRVLAFYGLTETKSENKFIPTIYKTGSLQQRLELLSGLIDTDGYVGKNGDISFTTVSEQLCDDVCEIVRSIGGIAKISTRVPTFTYKGEKKNGRLAYTVHIRYKNPRALVRLPRKLERISENYQYANTLRLEITSIELIGVKEAQCISIDDSDHLYITDDYVVTHNTTILQAISFALYGKALSKIKLKNLVNNINNKQMLVTIEFERGGISYRVERGRKPDVIKFYANNQEQKADSAGEEQGENKHTQKEIERVIGMSHTLFKHIVALNTYTDPFLRMSVGDQREVIEELMGVTQISTKADSLRAQIVMTKEAIRDQQTAIRAYTESNNRIGEQIDTTKIKSRRWMEDHIENLATLKAEIEALESIDYETEIVRFDELDAWQTKEREAAGAIDMAEREVALLRREFKTVEGESKVLLRDANNANAVSVVQRLTTEIDRKQSDHLRKARDIGVLAEKRMKCEYDLSNSDGSICVCCDQSLAGTDHLAKVTANLNEQIEVSRKEETRLGDELMAIAKEVDHLSAEVTLRQTEAEKLKEELLAKYVAKMEMVNAMAAKLKEQEDSFAEQTKLLSTLGDKPVTIFGSRDEVWRAKQLFETMVRDLEKETTVVNPFDAQIEALENTIQEVSFVEMNSLDSTLKHQEFLLKALTSKDSFIRKKMINQNLSYLNHRLEYYLDKLALPHKVQFMSDLSVEISLLGRDFDFEQLSRGEMNRVIMATSWSFRDVWESQNEAFNLMFVDEMLDQGTDAQGVEAALHILKAMARAKKNIFLISHRDDLQARIDRILTVRKENGFTSFEWEV
jgi:hypothetical protein